VSSIVNCAFRLLIVALVLLFANTSWGYAYDATPDYSFSQSSRVSLQKVEYDDTPNLCYRCINSSVENLQEKAQDGSFFAFEVGLVAAKGKELVPFFPANNGFIGQTENLVLKPGQIIDRFGGSAFSRFFSPQGVPGPMRALPPGTADQPLRNFEVLKPFTVEAGKIAPAL